MRNVAAGLAVLLVVGAVWIVLQVGRVEAGGACRGEPVTTERTATVEIGEMPCFTPTIVEISAGDTVTWRNSGSLPHNVVGAHASWGTYEEFGSGGSASHTFNQPGFYPYVCTLHPGMIGAVVASPATPGAASASLSESAGDAARAPGASEGDAANMAWALIAGAAAAVVVMAGVGGYAFGRRC